MAGGAVNSPLHDLAISTITSLSKWARCALADTHFWITSQRPGCVTDAHRSTLRQPACILVTTTYFDKIAIRDSLSAASNCMVTIASSISPATAMPENDTPAPPISIDDEW